MDENDYQKLYEKVTSSMGISSYGRYSFTLSSASLEDAYRAWPTLYTGGPPALLPKSDLDWPEDLLPGSGKMFGYIEAYRAWAFYLNSGLIGAAGISDTVNLHLWLPKKVIRAQVAADASRLGNGGGYYAAKNLDFILKEYSDWPYIKSDKANVFGKVALWGAIIEHKKGYRAEYAYPLEFYSVAKRNTKHAMEKHIIQQLNETYLTR